MGFSLTAASLLGTALIAFWFYYLQERRARSAATERLERAKAEVVLILEHNVVGKKVLNEETIDALLLASGREHGVNLREVCSPLSLFQDVSFRLQRSPHLNLEQKAAFQELLGEALAGFTSKGRTASSLDVLLERLQRAATEGDKKALEEAVSRVSRTFQDRAKANEQFDWPFLVMSILSVASILYLLVQTAPLMRVKIDEYQRYLFVLAFSVPLSFSLVSILMPILSRWVRRGRDKKRDSPNPRLSADG